MVPAAARVAQGAAPGPLRWRPPGRRMRVAFDLRGSPRARAAAAASALVLGGLAASAGDGTSQGAPSGEALFLRDCATCHLGRGGLIGNAALPDLLRGPLARGDGAEVLAAVIRNGTGSPRMPAFRDGLSDAEIAALVAWIRAERAKAK